LAIILAILATDVATEKSWFIRPSFATVDRAPNPIDESRQWAVADWQWLEFGFLNRQNSILPVCTRQNAPPPMAVTNTEREVPTSDVDESDRHLVLKTYPDA
jgi:hypothetical protein